MISGTRGRPGYLCGWVLGRNLGGNHTQHVVALTPHGHVDAYHAMERRLSHTFSAHAALNRAPSHAALTHTQIHAGCWYGVQVRRHHEHGQPHGEHMQDR